LLKENLTVLRLAFAFVVMGLIAALFGSGAFTTYSWEGAKILSLIFLALAALALLGDTFRRRSTWKG
jgi:uncharacterized membrane protein YtjA (UPF0391 family)